MRWPFGRSDPVADGDGRKDGPALNVDLRCVRHTPNENKMSCDYRA